MARYRRTGRSKPGAVEGHQLWRQLLDLVDEGLDQLLLGPLTDVGRADYLNLVAVGRPAGHDRANANDRVVDELREVVTHRRSDLDGGFAGKVVGSRVALEV